MRINLPAFLVFLFCITINSALAQSPNGSISGVVLDPDAKSIPAAEVIVLNDLNGLKYVTSTNGEGVYVLQNLPPGSYRIQVSKAGFKAMIKPDIVLNVQDALSINFTLPIGASSVVVTVEGGAPLINTTDASVSTVVDRQFAENLPMNGRSFQTLIQLTPGVVAIPSSANDGGQFSVNGQRGESNYWMVDGVSANIGITSNGNVSPGNGFGGAAGSFSVLGGTNSLVSVDALQEFRIQTSTYAPEFGRTPGGQISILTRSGTNQFHGTAFDYLRNDVLDANDWFADSKTLPKPKERQNDFGGTLSGPILKDRTFFFFSYDGLRLRLPQTALTTVPDASFTPGGTTNSRQNAILALQPFLNAYPLPNATSPEILCDPNTDALCPSTGKTGSAAFNASYSNPATLDAYSIRADHRLNNKLSLFGRYNYSPSELKQRGAGFPLSTIATSRITTQTATLGGASIFSPATTNDLRFNYSRVNASSRFDLDNFGGAAPLSSLPFPSPFTSDNGLFVLDIFALFNVNSGQGFNVGRSAKNLQRQINFVDNLSWQRGAHSLKFGVDFRRLAPLFDPAIYQQFAFFNNVSSAEAGNLAFSVVRSVRPAALLFKNLSVFAQDTWRIKPRLTITYGLRWDLDFAPSSRSGPNLEAVTGYNLNELSNLALAPAGTPPFNTRYGNIAPRLGLAYQVSRDQEWQTALRGGFGVFYDLVSSQAGSAFNISVYPFGTQTFNFGGTFPLDAAAAPPPIVPPNASNGEGLQAFNPHLQLPYTLEWNVAVEQELGKQQSLSASYVGSAGRRLLQAADIFTPNPNLHEAILFDNTATSDYSALQLQFNRRMSGGLQGLASYTWSHSIDDGSAGSNGIFSNLLPGALNGNANRGPSDFDIRHTLSAGVTYDLPAPKINVFTSAILRGWSFQSFILARSAPPVDVLDISLAQLASNNVHAPIRPDLVLGQPLYLYGAQCNAVLGTPCPAGKGFNPAAFTNPPIDPATMLPTRQGNLGRNALRGFGATQWDFGVHRDFRIHKSLLLQFRAEMFNVLNHPNFAPPSGCLHSFCGTQFGVSTQMLGQFFNGGTSGQGNLGGGAFNPLYQLGGPRSVQFALKFQF